MGKGVRIPLHSGPNRSAACVRIRTKSVATSILSGMSKRGWRGGTSAWLGFGKKYNTVDRTESEMTIPQSSGGVK